MNSDLRDFIAHYLTIIAGTLMAVSFFVFVSTTANREAIPGNTGMTQATTDAAGAATRI